MNRLRFASIIAVLFSSIGTLVMFVIGAEKTVKALRIYFLGEQLTSNPPPPPHLDATDQTMIAIVESIDAFLIGLVLTIFAVGVHNLFIKRSPSTTEGESWLHVRSVEHLKKGLMEVILVVLSVMFLREMLFLGEDWTFEALTIPAGVALLAIALKLLGWHTQPTADSDSEKVGRGLGRAA